MSIKLHRFSTAVLALSILGYLLFHTMATAAPNIIIFLADDLGYADNGANGCKEHYGTVPAPTEPASNMFRGNGGAGKEFASLGGQNLYLVQWEKAVADTRIHGSTCQQVDAHSRTVELPTLCPLPANLFQVFSGAPHEVHCDGCVEMDKSYYSGAPNGNSCAFSELFSAVVVNE